MKRELAVSGEQAFINSAFRIGFFASISYAVDYSFQLVDVFWVAKIGPGAPTAIAVVSSFLFLVLSVNEIIGVSSVAVFSQRFGSGNMLETERAIVQTLVLKLILGVLFSVAFLSSLELLLPFYSLTIQETEYVRNYTSIIWISIILVPVYSTMMTALRTIGSAAISSVISLLALVVNAVLNPLLIFGFGFIPAMGIAGAAWATILAQMLAMIGCIIAFSTNRQGVSIFRVQLLSLDMSLIKDLFLIGLPIGGVVLLYNAEQTLLANIVSMFPAEVSDGYSVGARIFGLLFMVNFGAALGIAVTVGHHLGQGQPDIVVEATRRIILYILLGLGILAGFLTLAAPSLAAVFSSNQITVQTATQFLRYMAVANIALGLFYCISAVFEGAGRNLPPFIAASIMYLGLEFPALIALKRVSDAELPTIWAVVVGASWVGTIVISRMFVTERW